MALSQNVVNETISAIHKGTDVHAVAEILGVTEGTVYYRINANKLVSDAAIERGIIRKSPPILPTVVGRDLPPANEPDPKPEAVTEDKNETITTKNGGKVVTNFSSVHADVRLIGNLPDILALLRLLKIKEVK